MSKPNFSSIHLIYGSVFILILISTAWLYWSSLDSLFLFDDVPNLEKLSHLDESKGFHEIVQFAIEGHAGTLGRPISLLTFALQAKNWPFSVWDFKYVNLIIHLLNGCLIFWFILLLIRLIALPEKRCLLLALFTATIWLLHPLQVSTVLYVIQRMTQLSTLFTLIGLLTYLYGRQLLAQKKLKSGFFWISLGVGLGGILATFSKENGILLVLYIIVLEITVLRHLSKPRWFFIWSSIFLYLPLILVALYFVTHIDSLLRTYEIRDFTMGERLLTQARVISDYISKILLLRPYDFGLFHDDFPISYHLLEPPTTLFAILFIGIMFVLAIIVRKILPILALGILWFLAGHVLESSFIGLMLYFEHRNYLPMVGIIFATVYGFIKLFDYLVNPIFRNIAFSVSLLLFSVFPLLTWLQTDLWSQPVKQTVLWAQQHPNSPAAQAQGIVVFQSIEQYHIAEKYAQNMIKVFPQFSAPYLYLVDLACNSEQVAMPDIEIVIQRIKMSQYDPVTLTLLISIIEKREKGECSIDPTTMDKLFNTWLNNPNNALYQAHFYSRYATYHASEKHYGLAVKMGKQALALKESIRLRFNIIKWLMADKQFDEAMFFLTETKTLLNPIKRHLYHKELSLFEAQIPVMQELHQMGIEVDEK
jgi:protein O-mannosyl-transferase